MRKSQPHGTQHMFKVCSEDESVFVEIQMSKQNCTLNRLVKGSANASRTSLISVHSSFDLNS